MCALVCHEDPLLTDPVTHYEGEPPPKRATQFPLPCGVRSALEPSTPQSVVIPPILLSSDPRTPTMMSLAPEEVRHDTPTVPRPPLQVP